MHGHAHTHTHNNNNSKDLSWWSSCFAYPKLWLKYLVQNQVWWCTKEVKSQKELFKVSPGYIKFQVSLGCRRLHPKKKKKCLHEKSYFSKYSRAKKSGKKITRNSILFAPIWGQSLPQDCSKRLASKQPSTLSSVNICMSMFTKQNKQPGEAQPSGIMLFKSNLAADSCLCSLGIPS